VGENPDNLDNLDKPDNPDNVLRFNVMLVFESRKLQKTLFYNAHCRAKPILESFGSGARISGLNLRHLPYISCMKSGITLNLRTLSGLSALSALSRLSGLSRSNRYSNGYGEFRFESNPQKAVDTAHHLLRFDRSCDL